MPGGLRRRRLRRGRRAVALGPVAGGEVLEVASLPVVGSAHRTGAVAERAGDRVVRRARAALAVLVQPDREHERLAAIGTALHAERSGGRLVTDSAAVGNHQRRAPSRGGRSSSRKVSRPARPAPAGRSPSVVGVDAKPVGDGIRDLADREVCALSLQCRRYREGMWLSSALSSSNSARRVKTAADETTDAASPETARPSREAAHSPTPPPSHAPSLLELVTGWRTTRVRRYERFSLSSCYLTVWG